MAKVFQFAAAMIIAYVVMQFVPAFDNPFAPGPQPQPPGPVRPDDEPNFSKYEDEVYKAILKVKSKGRAQECKQLSGDVQNIIKRIDGGTIDNNQAVVDALVVAFKKLPMSWYGQIRNLTNTVLQPLTNNGSLSTTLRWKALLEVADRGIIRAGKESTGVESDDNPKQESAK
jgi:hypothetical protein